MEVFSSGVLKVLPQCPRGIEIRRWGYSTGVLNNVLTPNHYILSRNLGTLYQHEVEN